MRISLRWPLGLVDRPRRGARGASRMVVRVRTALLVVVAAWLFASPWTGQAAQDVPSFARDVPKVRSGPPVLAFNGKDLSGFYTYLHDHKYDDPDKVFSVRDGVLVISG